MLQNGVIVRLFLIHTVKNDPFIQLLQRHFFDCVGLGSGVGSCTRIQRWIHAHRDGSLLLRHLQEALIVVASIA